MLRSKLSGSAGLILLLSTLACAVVRQTPQPGAELEQLVFEVQRATATITPILSLQDVPTYTPDPNATSTPLITTTLTLTATLEATSTVEATIAAPTEPKETETSEVVVTQALPEPSPTPTPATLLAEPLRGGVWDFETGFVEWRNPYGDDCAGSGLAIGWSAFTTRDQYGSSCMNQTVWKDNVYSGESAQEITFAFVGSQAGVFKTAPTIPGHRYTVEAYFRREFSPAKVEVSLGIDLNGGTDWQAASVQWFPWDEDLDNAWSRTEETMTATGEAMTIFIKGVHPYPEPGGTLRIDSVSIVDIGSE